VFQEPERAEGRQDATEEGLARGEWQRPQIEVLEPEQIEAVERHRATDSGVPDVDRAVETGAALEPLEAGLALCIQGDDLTIQYEVVEGQRGDRANHLGKRGGAIIAVPREETRSASAARRQHSIAVELRLEQPFLPRERRVGGLG
jgi:hypothetical protein